MTWKMLTRPARLTTPLLALALVSGLAGCNDPLEVSDPLTVLDEDVNDATGAELLARGALFNLYGTVGNAAWQSGLLADEFLYQQAALWDPSGRVSPDELLDRRATEEHLRQWGGPNGAIVNGSYSQWQALRLRSTAVAIEKLRAYGVPGAREARIGEMFAVRGFAALNLAEQFCPGFPLHRVVNYQIVYSRPVSTAQAFESALADFDSAVSWAADSARVLNFARVGRARALLNLGRFGEAAGAVADVSTGYVYQTEYDPGIVINPLASVPGGFGESWGNTRSVADREGGNGLNFVSARDPRVPTDSLGTARDGVTRLYGADKYPTTTTPMVLASGVEARLIEAEAALQAGDVPAWLGKLNQLRRTAMTPPMADATDPGTTGGRVDLLFRERAFWLFATGHRLGDLRRLMRQYNRSAESVFPAGAYWRGGAYSTATNFPFDLSEMTFSPGVTGCTSE